MFEAQHVTILLVEDDPGHARLIEKNLRRAKIANQIIHVDDGQKAVDFLLRQGEYAGREHPDNLLVMLDLNMPVMDGYQVLERIKQEESTRRIPVIVLTTTDDLREVSRCYDLGCNVYVTKPVDYESFTEAIKNLGMFVSVVTVPKEEEHS